MNIKTKAWVNMGLFLLTLGINTLGAFGFINGLSQKEVSDAYPTLITPSPATFSIWGVIYALLLISLIFMIAKHKEERTANLINTISVPFWISCVINILWIIAFSYELIGISTILIVAFVVTLAVINRKLQTPDGIGQKVNALAFGSVMSASLKEVLKDHSSYRSDIEAHTPLGRIASASELAEAAQYLASDSASFLTGQIITVDGGRSLLDPVAVPAH